MPAPINLPIAHAIQAFWWASLQGLEGVRNDLTVETSLDSLRMICHAEVSEHLSNAAASSCLLIAKRRGERRGTVG
jgi:hypothetical protein